MPLRLIFMGTPDFATPTLAAIAEAGHEIAAVYTRAPRPAGRGMALQPSPVEREARRRGFDVRAPKSLRMEEEAQAFRALKADAAVVVAYGLILPKPVLDGVAMGCFNVHASALPRWRGAAPISRAIMAGDTQTAVMVMRMEEGLDTGEIALAKHFDIGADMTAGELHDRLAPLGAELMVEVLAALERGTLTLTPQSAQGVTYAAKIDKAETRIDWTRPWREVHNHCRGLSPFPGAWFEMNAEGRPVRVKVLHTTMGAGAGAPGTVLDDKLTVACGDGAVRLVEVQRAGRQPMSVEDFLRGTPLAPGTRLG